ncbi:hypothetical protein NLI96_g8926 [Meripilus lineatus]|uniref:Uncharacterized protein n=1 Tax=Meripilus lineatus TaxID=2056292 RepID=A0AAD5UY49_9APHY|nr:hypothetical protein NLI96_g8926 [Physisporinus lineatus]
MGSRIRTRNDALRPCMDEVSGGGVPEADWKKVVRGEEYVGIQIRDDGNHGDEWYYEDLQSSCKMRVEFMWSNLRHWREGFRSILDEFETDVRVPMSG